MSRYRVFLGSPPRAANEQCTWQIASSTHPRLEQQPDEETGPDEDRFDETEADDMLAVASTQDSTAPSFAQSASWQLSQSQTASQRPIVKSHSHISRYFDTQETQEQESLVNSSEHSSIAHFPSFSFAVRTLVSLSSLVAKAQTSCPAALNGSVLVAVLDANGPSSVVVRKGPNAGSSITVLELLVGDESEKVMKITAWLELADKWGNLTQDTGLKKGDIAVFENISVQFKNGEIAAAASTNLKSSCIICYRTFLAPDDDKRLQPDLRLGESDAAVRKVSEVSRWYANRRGKT